MERPASIIRASRPEYRRPVKIDNTVVAPDTSDIWWRIFGDGDSNVSRYVSESTVIGIPAVDFALNLVSYSVAQMMVAAKAYDFDNNIVTIPPIVNWPNMNSNPTAFWQQVVRTLLLHGNYVGIVVGDQVVPVPPGAVALDTQSGYPLYTIGDATFERTEVVHIAKDAPAGGFWGKGVLTKFVYALEGQLSQQTYGKTSFTTAGVPSAVITLDTANVSETQMSSVKEQWTERTRDGRQPVVLPKSVSVQPLSWSPHDAQYDAARAAATAEAAYMLGMTPSALEAAVGTGSGTQTYANLTDRQLARVTETYAAVLALVEEEWTRLTPGLTIKGTVEALLRSSPRERLELTQLANSLGIAEHADPSTPEDNAS